MLTVYDLTCEYLENPLGIGVQQPRLSWKLRSPERGARQTAYQIVVASTREALQRHEPDLWDSGKVFSDQSVHIVYAGKDLDSGTRAWWSVRVWDASDQESPLSDAAWWEMGLLQRSDWIAKWIGTMPMGGTRTTAPCPYLRKRFSVDQEVVSARVYATALGLYELSINGQRVGADVFTPGWTDYTKRVQYQVYDVTTHIRRGENAVGALLGDGWYCGFVAWNGRQNYGDRPRLFAQLVLTFANGERLVIPTDETWKTTFGALLESDMLHGESYDARMELPNWDHPEYEDGGWLPVHLFDDPGIELMAMRGAAVQAAEEITPVGEPRLIPHWSDPKWIFDMGQNMVGRVRLKVRGQRGTTITLRYGEMLDKDGNLYTTNLRTARQTDYYTLKGTGDETHEIFESRFTFHGFRYVELSGYSGTPTIDMITGIVLHSAMRQTGTFECSDPLLNQLQHNIVWGQKGNFVDIPTDCPQRDERLGWTGDAQVFIRTATHNFNVAPFFTKWHQDLRDSQSSVGEFPPTVPNISSNSKDGGPAWADAGIICPWTIYQCYGDVQQLADHYPAMVKFIDHLTTQNPDYIRSNPERDSWGGFGDWLSLNADTPKDLIGTAFFAYSAKLMIKIARVLGYSDDAEKYQQLWSHIRDAFVHRFVTPEGIIAGGTQTAYVLALHFDLLPKDLRETAARRLVRDIEGRGKHLSTGFVGTPYLLHVLTQTGHVSTALDLLHQKTFPSWLYPVLQGATTIWERWDGWTEDKGFQDPGMNSFNHYAYGAVGDWLYSTLAGIDVDESCPGYKHIRLHPLIDPRLSFVRGSYESMYGTIRSEWHMSDGVLHWDVSIPPNTEALLTIPVDEADTCTVNNQDIGQALGISEIQRGASLTCRVVSGNYLILIHKAQKNETQ